MVVVGRVDRVERHGTVLLAHLDVSHVARGSMNVSDGVLFLAESLHQTPPVGQLGQRVLAFLEPSGREAPVLTAAFQGAAVLPVFAEGGEELVGATEWGRIQLPQSLCQPRPASSNFFACVARLKDVLKALRLPPDASKVRPPAVFRVLRRQCEPCDLERWTRPSSSMTRACGSVTDRKSRALAEPCIKDALREDAPFTVAIQRPGIDSEIITAFVREPSGAREFWYDSSVEGGPDCAASVRVRDCAAIALANSEGWLRCRRPGRWRQLCSQADARVEILEVGGTANQLLCSENCETEFVNCGLGARPGLDGGVVPSADGPDLLCARDGDTMQCQAESQWPSKAPH
jgi:hypothetical protein